MTCKSLKSHETCRKPAAGPRTCLRTPRRSSPTAAHPDVHRNPVEELSPARHRRRSAACGSASGGCERCFALGSRMRHRTVDAGPGGPSRPATICQPSAGVAVHPGRQFRATRPSVFRPNSRRSDRSDCRRIGSHTNITAAEVSREASTVGRDRVPHEWRRRLAATSCRGGANGGRESAAFALVAGMSRGRRAAGWRAELLAAHRVVNAPPYAGGLDDRRRRRRDSRGGSRGGPRPLLCGRRGHRRRRLSPVRRCRWCAGRRPDT